MSVRIPQTRDQLHPAGEYRARIYDIVETEGQFGIQLQFLFSLLDVPPDVATVRGWASAKFSPRSKLYAWTKAAFGGGLIPLDQEFDSEDLLGRPVLLTLVIRDREDGSQFNKIDSVRAATLESPV